MKRESGIRNYYEEYLEVCHSFSPLNKLSGLHKILDEKILGAYYLPFGVCLLDYSSRKYAYMCEHSEEVVGHPRNRYIEDGVDFHNRIWAPEDWNVFDKQVFRDVRDYWKLIPQKEISQYRFSFNYRITRSDGRVIQCLQHSTYLEPQSGVPVLNLATFSDISDFKTDDSIVLTISRLVDGVGYVNVFNKSYLPSTKAVLSAREVEVLRLSHEGLSSKIIADKLFISLQTVKNHKRNMMGKTSTRNISGLINLSLKNKWI